MNLQCIAEHTVDLDLLTGGIVIDAGCLNWQFSTAMREFGEKVLALDIQKLIPPEGVTYINAALTKTSGLKFYTDTQDAQAKFISIMGIEIISLSLPELYKHLNNEVIDCIKCDIEGSEYELLSDPEFEPKAKQISCEFHAHAHPELHAKYYDAVMDNLLKWYEPVKHEWTTAHGAGYNYWDSLFIRKDLI